MASMRVAQVPGPGALSEIVDRPIPAPGAGTVRIRVQACGICHSDSMTRDGLFPGIQYPRIPGHEVAGVIEAIGAGVLGWEPGQRVGVGWNGGDCGDCDPCRRGEFFACVRGQVTGISFDGGYGGYMIAPAGAVARMPDDLQPIETAPLMCAGLTTQVSPVRLLMGNRAVKGWSSGTSIDSQDTLAFRVLAGVRPMNEAFPLERVAEAYDRMMSGRARSRVVLAIAESPGSQ